MYHTLSIYRNVKLNVTNIIGFVQIQLQNNIKQFILQGRAICAHGHSKGLLEDLIPQNCNDIVNEDLQHCSYIDFRECVETDWCLTK